MKFERDGEYTRVELDKSDEAEVQAIRKARLEELQNRPVDLFLLEYDRCLDKI